MVKPTVQEINIKGNSKDGFADAFAYEGGSEEERKSLGSLYVIGNVKEDQIADGDANLDMAYVVNLVASLAKREYFANANREPRQAFSSALRKVNDVIEEFFKNKNLKLDVGIFAIAGENIYISKVGKFKVMLARDDRSIDILNNIDLFSREHVQEKEFSNIVSGTVKEGDKILAFFPSRQMVARERTFKTSLAKMDGQDFSAKLASIVDEKPEFSCCALHISMSKVKEPAVVKKPKQAIKPQPQVSLAAIKEEPAQQEAPVTELASESEINEPEAPIEEVVVAQEVPKIIPSEFAMGKKRSAVTAAISRVRLAPMHKKNRVAIFAVGALILIFVALGAKAVFFQSSDEKAESATLEEANQNIAQAQAMIGENNLAEARKILNSSLANISKIDSDDARDKENEIIAEIDKIDNAQIGKLTLYATVNPELGTATNIQARGNDLVAFVDKGEAGALVKVSNNNTSILGETSDLNPHLSTGNSEKTVFINSGSGQFAMLNGGNIESGSSIPVMADAAYYEGNIYLIEGGVIKKITDISSGSNTAKDWLVSGESANGSRIGVDGNVYTIGESGTLTTYFKGKKSAEVATGLPVNGEYRLITSASMNNIYLVNKNMGRFYALDKKTGAIIKTVKTDSNSSLVDGMVTDDGSMYVLSKDNKIWKLE